MPTIIALAALAVSSLFGIATVMDKADEAAEKSSLAMLNLGGLLMLGIGAYIIYKMAR